jgi:preprotein translocase subunit SecF
VSNTQGEQPDSRRAKIAGAITAVVLLVVIGGAGFTIAKANADAQAHTALMVEVKADGKTLHAASTEDAQLQASANTAAAYQENRAQVAADAAVRAAAEQAAAAAAAEQAAAQAAADAAAQQASQQPTPQGTATDTGSGSDSSSGAASGTPVPFTPSSDPNNAAGGDYADPGSFCASHSASTVNGVPTCD